MNDECPAFIRIHTGGVFPLEPGLETCPLCECALVDGACPNGHTIVRCPRCDSIMKDGACPVCGVVETCPTCGSALVDGMCPNGGPHVNPCRCPRCDAILKNGVCPKCGETECCPTCGSELVDGACPNGCTVMRCPVCSGILVSGGCPNGCPPTALNLGWSGSEKPAPSPWRLEVVEPAGFAGEACELPFVVVLGRTASEKKLTDAYIQLRFDDRRKASACPRRFVKLVCDSATAEVAVEMLSRVGRAAVDGRTLSAPGDKAVLPEGGILDLQQTGYRLKLVRASAEESAR